MKSVSKTSKEEITCHVSLKGLEEHVLILPHERNATLVFLYSFTSCFFECQKEGTEKVGEYIEKKESVLTMSVGRAPYFHF